MGNRNKHGRGSREQTKWVEPELLANDDGEASVATIEESEEPPKNVPDDKTTKNKLDTKGKFEKQRQKLIGEITHFDNKLKEVESLGPQKAIEYLEEEFSLMPQVLAEATNQEIKTLIDRLKNINKLDIEAIKQADDESGLKLDSIKVKKILDDVRAKIESEQTGESSENNPEPEPEVALEPDQSESNLPPNESDETYLIDTAQNLEQAYFDYIEYAKKYNREDYKKIAKKYRDLQQDVNVYLDRYLASDELHKKYKKNNGPIDQFTKKIATKIVAIDEEAEALPENPDQALAPEPSPEPQTDNTKKDSAAKIAELEADIEAIRTAKKTSDLKTYFEKNHPNLLKNGVITPEEFYGMANYFIEQNKKEIKILKKSTEPKIVTTKNNAQASETQGDPITPEIVETASNDSNNITDDKDIIDIKEPTKDPENTKPEEPKDQPWYFTQARSPEEIAAKAEKATRAEKDFLVWAEKTKATGGLKNVSEEGVARMAKKQAELANQPTRKLSPDKLKTITEKATKKSAEREQVKKIANLEAEVGNITNLQKIYPNETAEKRAAEIRAELAALTKKEEVVVETPEKVDHVDIAKIFDKPKDQSTEPTKTKGKFWSNVWSIITGANEQPKEDSTEKLEKKSKKYFSYDGERPMSEAEFLEQRKLKQADIQKQNIENIPKVATEKNLASGDIITYIDHTGNKVTGKVISEAGLLGYRVKKSGLAAKLFGGDEFVDPRKVIEIKQAAEQPKKSAIEERHKKVLPQQPRPEKIIATYQGWDKDSNQPTQGEIELPQEHDGILLGDTLRVKNREENDPLALWKVTGTTAEGLIAMEQSGKIRTINTNDLTRYEKVRTAKITTKPKK